MQDEQGRKRGNRTTKLKPNEVSACPQCDEAAVQRANNNNIAGPESNGPTYRCARCFHRFDTFVIREQKAKPSLKGLTKQLYEANPEDINQ